MLKPDTRANERMRGLYLRRVALGVPGKTRPKVRAKQAQRFAIKHTTDRPAGSGTYAPVQTSGSIGFSARTGSLRDEQTLENIISREWLAA